jgi:hypothetical protein
MECIVIYIYVIPIVSLIGFLLSILCFFIFLNKEFKEVLYKYLKVESLLISMNLFIQIFRPVYFYNASYFSKTLFSQIYSFYILYYFVSSLEMASFLLHIMSSLDFFLLISNLTQKLTFYKKLNYKLVSVIIFLFSISIYIYIIFIKEIRSHDVLFIDSKDVILSYTIIYLSYDTEFSKTTVKKIMEISVVVLRDGIFLLTLVILNIIIYLHVRSSIMKKRRMLNRDNGSMIKTEAEAASIDDLSINNHPTTINVKKSKSERKNNKAQYKLTIMVIIGSLNCILGRLPILSDFIVQNIIGWNDQVKLLNMYACLAVYVSYSINFFLYMYTNKRFNKIFFQYLQIVFKPLRN